MQVDYLIVGQGLAGSVLAEHLLNMGLSVKVISDASLSNSSKVAGGLFNPITGRKMVKTWHCDRLFDYLIPFYRGLEHKLKTDFLVETPIYRPFYSIEEQNEWMGKSAESDYAPYIEKVYQKPGFGHHVQDEFGGILLKKSGYLKTAEFIAAYEEYLASKGLLVNDTFDFDALELEDNGVSYKGISAKKIVFCDGRLLEENPFFKWLPLRPVKGELLFLDAESEQEQRVIYNRGVFVVPLGDGKCKVGATYEHQNLNEAPTLKAKTQLIDKLSGLVKFRYKVTDQKAGVRPATKDRRPFLGKHPEHKCVYVFNGLGAKGVSLAPFYANQFAQWMEGNTNLEDEVNIERFFSLF
ncbi:NAD(P)/FAD-dependent oxidoreductase [Roseivirga pacifica]